MHPLYGHLFQKDKLYKTLYYTTQLAAYLTLTSAWQSKHTTTTHTLETSHITNQTKMTNPLHSLTEHTR